MATDAVVTKRLEVGFFRFRAVAGGLCFASFFLVARADLVPRPRPSLAIYAGQLRQRFLGFLLISVIER